MTSFYYIFFGSVLVARIFFYFKILPELSITYSPVICFWETHFKKKIPTSSKKTQYRQVIHFIIIIIRIKFKKKLHGINKREKEINKKRVYSLRLNKDRYTHPKSQPLS